MTGAVEVGKWFKPVTGGCSCRWWGTVGEREGGWVGRSAHGRAAPPSNEEHYSCRIPLRLDLNRSLAKREAPLAKGHPAAVNYQLRYAKSLASDPPHELGPHHCAIRKWESPAPLLKYKDVDDKRVCADINQELLHGRGDANAEV